MLKSRSTRITVLILVVCIILSVIGSVLTGGVSREKGSIREVMRDAVLHEEDKISLFGLIDVNPSVISAFTVTGMLLLAAAVIRIFAIPRFRRIPGKFQILVEKLVGYFDGLAKENSPGHHGFLSVYIFSAGIYIFFSTIFELFGLQAVSAEGASVTLSAPLADINGAIAMGFQSYAVILIGGICINRLRGAGSALKEFSLPISMSFRLFGALLSGLLVTELVYYTIYLSIVLPVAVAVMFTLIHALIQTYVLTMLTSVFFGEVTEKHEKKKKEKNIKGSRKADLTEV